MSRFRAVGQGKERLAFDATLTPDSSGTVLGTEDTVATPTCSRSRDSAIRRSEEPLQAKEQRELTGDIHRFRTMALYSIPLWWVFLALVWIVVAHIEPGRLWDYALLRLATFIPLLAAAIRLSRRPLEQTARRAAPASRLPPLETSRKVIPEK